MYHYVCIYLSIYIYMYIYIWRFPEMVVPPVLIHVIFGFSIINQPFWGYPFDGNPQIKDPQNCNADDSRMWKTWISIGEVTTCHGFSAHCPTYSRGISPSLWVSSSVLWGLLKVAWGSMGPYRRIHPGNSLCFSLCQRKLLEHVRTCFSTTENWHETWNSKKIPLKSSFPFPKLLLEGQFSLPKWPSPSGNEPRIEF